MMNKFFEISTTSDLNQELQLTSLNLLVASSLLNNEQKKTLLQKKGVKIVSIGEDCFSRTVPTRWKIKPRKHEGEKTHPFDLAVHPIDAIIEIIQNRFSDYSDPVQFKLTNANVVIHRKYKCTFNHEADTAFFENDFRLLIQTIERRVSNFLSLELKGECLLFIYHTKRNSNAKARKINILLDSLMGLFPNTRVHLFVVDSYNQIICNELYDSIGYFGLSYPCTEYIWHDRNHYSKPEGIMYELLFIQRLSGFISEHVLA